VCFGESFGPRTGQGKCSGKRDRVRRGESNEKAQGLDEVNEMGSEMANANSSEVGTTTEPAVVVSDDQLETNCVFEDASAGLNTDGESDKDVELENYSLVRSDEIDAQWKDVLSRAKSRSRRQSRLRKMKTAMT